MIKTSSKNRTLLMAIVFLFTIAVLPAGPAAAATTYTVHNPQSWGSNDLATLKFSVRIDPCDVGQHAAIVQLPNDVLLDPGHVTITTITSGPEINAVDVNGNLFRLEINNPVVQKVEFLVTMQARLNNFRGVITADIINLYGDLTSWTIGDQGRTDNGTGTNDGTDVAPSDKENGATTNGESNGEDTPDPVDPTNGETSGEDDPDPVDPTGHTVVFTLGSGSYTVNGVQQTMDTAAFARDGRTYLPIRYTALAMGVHESDILWHGAHRTVTLNWNDKTVQLQVDSKTMIINDTRVDLDAGPMAKDGRTFLPFRSIASAFGATVVYDAANQTVTMITNP